MKKIIAGMLMAGAAFGLVGAASSWAEVINT